MNRNTFRAREKAEERFKESLGEFSLEVYEKWMQWRDLWTKEYTKEYENWRKAKFIGCTEEQARFLR